MDDVDLVNQKLALMKAPERLIPPDNVADEELRYISELLAAYADALGCDVLTQSDLSDPKLYRFQKDFSKQRRDFYAAETIRRASRDSLATYGIEAFQSLKDETYAGIEDTLDNYYENGFLRLKAVTRLLVSSVNRPKPCRALLAILFSMVAYRIQSINFLTPLITLA